MRHKLFLIYKIFQLTRSVGSVTLCSAQVAYMSVFQLTRSVGSVTKLYVVHHSDANFNSHAPWGA